MRTEICIKARTPKSAQTLRKLLLATAVIWPLRAQSRKKSPRISVWDLSSLGPSKSKTESKKSQNSWKQSNSRFGLFFDSALDFLDARCREALETHFELFLPLWAQSAQMTPVAGPENPSANHLHPKWRPRICQTSAREGCNQHTFLCLNVVFGNYNAISTQATSS